MSHIIYENGKYKYLDKDGFPIEAGDSVKMPDGRIKKVYLTEEGYLGTDATNPVWIERGLAVEGQYGIYPFEEDELESIALCIELH